MIKFFFLENKNKFMEIYYSKLLRNPAVLIDHILCSSAFIWDPNAWMKSKMQLKTIGGIRWIPTPNKHDIKSNSKLHDFIVPLTNYVKLSTTLWKPAIYLYLLVFIVIWLLLYQNNRILIIMFIPIFAHSLGLALVSITPEFRFQFPVIVLSQFIWVLLLNTRIPKQN